MAVLSHGAILQLEAFPFADFSVCQLGLGGFQGEGIYNYKRPLLDESESIFVDGGGGGGGDGCGCGCAQLSLVHIPGWLVLGMQPPPGETRYVYDQLQRLSVATKALTKDIAFHVPHIQCVKSSIIRCDLCKPPVPGGS